MNIETLGDEGIGAAESRPGSWTRDAGPMTDEIEFYTDLALQECQRWLESVTWQRFEYDDFFASLASGDVLVRDNYAKLSAQELQRVKRVVRSISELGRLGLGVGLPGPDQTALLPLLSAAIPELARRPPPASLSSDPPPTDESPSMEGCAERLEALSEMAASEKVNRYLADLDDDASDSTAVSGLSRQRQPRVSANPLHFVAAMSGARSLADQAKTLMNNQEEQARKLKEQRSRNNNLEEEEDWVSNLESWRSKRKGVKTAPSDEASSSSACGGGGGGKDWTRAVRDPSPAMKDLAPASEGHFHSRDSSGAWEGVLGGCGEEDERLSSGGGNRSMEDDIIRQSRCPSAAPASPDSGTHEGLSPRSDSSADAPKPKLLPTAHLHSALYAGQAPRKWKYQEKETPKSFEKLTMVIQTRGTTGSGFGFSLKGGSERGEALAIAGVVLKSPADKAKVLVGDAVLALDGVSMDAASQADANLLIRKALEKGQITLELSRAQFEAAPRMLESNPNQRSISPRSGAGFDDKRGLFSHEDERATSRGSSGHHRPATLNGSAHSLVQPVNGLSEMEDEWAALAAGGTRYRPPGKIVDFVPELERSAASLSPCPADYRVSSMDVRREPGRITDFVPESERSASSAASESPASEGRPFTRDQDILMERLTATQKPLRLDDSSPTPSSQALSPLSSAHDGTDEPSSTATRKPHIVVTKRVEQQSTRARRVRPHSILVNESSLEEDSSGPEAYLGWDYSKGPKEAEERRSFGHVRRDIVFAKEPAPWEPSTELALLSLAAASPKASPPTTRRHPMPQLGKGTQEHWLVQEAEDLRLSEQMRRQPSPQAPRQPSPVHTERRPPPPVHVEAPKAAHPPAPVPPAAVDESPAQPPLLSVSGRQNCTHCGEQLGRGAAMIIESLHLFYHVGCFRCCVCGASLGSGSMGADVRVRSGRLHCHSCYSNHEAGLQLSQV